MNHRIPAVLGAALVLFTGAALAQEPIKSLSCDQRGNGGRQERACEMREMTLPATGALKVDSAPNGGVSVKAWSKREFLLRARVDTWGDTKSEAESRLKQVDIATAGGKVSAEGPKTMGKTYYSVSYEVFVPSKIDLDLHTVNGGVSVKGVTGTITAGTTNGGLTLTDLAGKVTARTTNGGVKVQLAGAAWQGEGFDVSTVNGGVTIQVPTDYSAQLEVKTVNGGLQSDVPVTVQGKYSGKRVSAKLGKGGAPVTVSTTNGGVRLRRAGV